MLVVDAYENLDREWIGAWAKGHHDTHQFLILASQWGIPDLLNYAGIEERVNHDWWRCIPDKRSLRGYIFWTAEPHSRGAFPVTYVLFPYSIRGPEVETRWTA